MISAPVIYFSLYNSVGSRAVGLLCSEFLVLARSFDQVNFAVNLILGEPHVGKSVNLGSEFRPRHVCL